MLYDIMMVAPEIIIGIIFGLVAVKFFDAKFPGGLKEAMLIATLGAFFGEFLIMHIPVLDQNANLLHAFFGIAAGICSILFLIAGNRFRSKSA